MTEHHPLTQPATVRVDSPGLLSFSRQAIIAMVIAAVVGGLGAVGGASLYTNGMQRVMLAYLVAVAFVLSISLGSLFFLLIQHLMRAKWAVLVRRPAEVFAMNTVTVALLALPIAAFAFAGEHSIYPWARGGESAANAHWQAAALGHDHGHEDPAEPHLYPHQTFDELTARKTAWLNPTLFVIRLALYFAVWIGISAFYFYHSRRQDAAGGVADTLQMEKWSAPALIALGVTLTFAAFDLLMSLDPHWYSTIYGVYFFAGCAVGGFAAVLLSWLVLSRLGLTPARLSDEHFRDLGRLLFAFVFFWAYIAFSQYMLLWYANVPETTRWLTVRGASLAEGYRNTWGWLLLLLLFGHFLIPFLGFMSRHVKGRRAAMIFWTIWLLALHYLDLLWLVMPEFRPHLTFGLPEVGTLILVGGLYVMGASFFATRTALIPIGDPRLEASLAMIDAY